MLRALAHTLRRTSARHERLTLLAPRDGVMAHCVRGCHVRAHPQHASHIHNPAHQRCSHNCVVVDARRWNITQPCLCARKSKYMRTMRTCLVLHHAHTCEIRSDPRRRRTTTEQCTCCAVEVCPYGFCEHAHMRSPRRVVNSVVIIDDGLNRH